MVLLLEEQSDMKYKYERPWRLGGRKQMEWSTESVWHGKKFKEIICDPCV